MKISIIIPSQLKRARDGEPYLIESAITSVYRQKRWNCFAEFEIVIGLDPGACVPLDVGFLADDSVRFVERPDAKVNSPAAAAMNAAAREATGDYLAILCDDDWWRPEFLSVAIPLLERFDFIAGTSLIVDQDENTIRIDDFPLLSTWVMRRSLFEAVGPFDETLFYRNDNEWLGRLGHVAKTRAHLVENSAPTEELLELGTRLADVRPGLARVLQFGRPKPTIIRHQSPLPLVVERVFPASLTDRLVTGAEPAAAAKLQACAEVCSARHGYVPW